LTPLEQRIGHEWQTTCETHSLTRHRRGRVMKAKKPAKKAAKKAAPAKKKAAAKKKK
jgi:hypothetical protein